MIIKKSEGGFSLVELLLVASAVIILSLLVMSLPSAISSINRSRHISIAKDIANRQVEELRKVTYANLVSGTNPFSDSQLSSLPGSSASYEVEDCPVGICAEPGYNIKQIKITISWNEYGEDRKVELATLIGEGGLGQ